MITKEKFAEKLNGREYGNEITIDEILEAEASGLIVVFGQSDDLMEFRGHINAELEVYGNKWVYFSKHGVDNHGPRSWRVSVNWDGVWKYFTGIPHATFNIYENKELYCRGMVMHKSVFPFEMIQKRSVSIYPAEVTEGDLNF